MSLTKLTQALPANQAIVSLNVSGWFFLCTSARGVFQISFDEGQTFNDWEKGLARDMESKPFKKLIFRTTSDNSAANTIKFYYGTEVVKDSRLNVIDDSAKATIQTIEPRTFLTIYSDLAIQGTATNFPANRVLQLDDPVLGYRRAQLTFTNWTASTRLYVGDAILDPLNGIVANVFAEIVGDATNPIPFVYSASGTIFVGNPGAAVRVRILDKFFTDPDFFA